MTRWRKVGVETGYTSWGAGLIDLDNDGNPDVLFVTGSVYPEVERKLPQYPYKTQRVLFRKWASTIPDACSTTNSSRWRRPERLLSMLDVYARLCDGRHWSDWPMIVHEADEAVRKLVEARYVFEPPPDGQPPDFIAERVGSSFKSVELTGRGLDALQLWHPPIALKLRAWIAVLPRCSNRISCECNRCNMETRRIWQMGGYPTALSQNTCVPSTET